MPVSIAPFKIFSGTNSRYVAEKIAQQLGCNLGNMRIEHFSDGEFSVSFEESIRGQYIYLVQSTFPNSDNLMELLLMIDAAKRASAYKIIAVLPYFGWARQDRKDKPRVSIGAKLIADMLSIAGLNRVITMDLHADQIQGFFNIPVDHLFASTIFVPYIRSLNMENVAIASPDVGGSKRAGSYAKHLDVPMVLGYKTREKANEVSEMKIIGKVKGKNVIIVDDMVDTAGTLCKAANLIMDEGAASVRAIVTHGVMSGKAIDNIMNSALEQIVFTDSIPFDCSRCSKVKILTVSSLFAETISRVQSNRSISEQYLM